MLSRLFLFIMGWPQKNSIAHSLRFCFHLLQKVNCGVFLDLNANDALDEGEPSATSGNDGRFAIALTQYTRAALGATTPYLNAALVLNSGTGKCIDVSTGVLLPAAWLQKAPFPAAQQNYQADSTIAVSPLTTLAAFVMSAGDLSAGPTASFSKVAAALSLNGSGVDLAQLDPARYGLQGDSAQAKASAGVIISTMNVQSVISLGAIIVGGGNATLGSERAVFAALAQTVIASTARRRRLQAGTALDLTDGAVIGQLLTAAAANAVASGAIAVAPSAASLSLVVAALSNLNTATKAAVLAATVYTVSTVQFLAIINSIYNAAYVANTQLTTATAALAAGGSGTAYATATSAAALAAAVSGVDVRLLNAALYWSAALLISMF